MGVRRGGDVAGFIQRAEAKGLGDRVLFAGRVEESEKWQYLHHSDFFCLPSRAEGQPIAIIEAMAVGLPIIAYAVGSILEMIETGKSGLVLPVGDKAALAEAIARIAGEAGLRQHMGMQAQQTARKRHNIGDQFRSLASAYHGLTGIPAPQSSPSTSHTHHV